MTPDDFSAFFEALYGYQPFLWQRRLMKRIAEDGWSNTNELALPTGAGKMAVMDLAIFHLALEAQLPVEQRQAARRICFVVDRRVVVDEAHRRARLIARKLRQPDADILKNVAEALSSLTEKLQIESNKSQDEFAPLSVVAIRGGLYRDDSWSASPVQPVVAVSTVDQIGSRLLFRGYGLTDGMKPIAAGLLSRDTLLILDEAHLSHAFEQTAMSVREMIEREPIAGPGPLQIVRMTATPTQLENAFRLESEDYEDTEENQELLRRLRANKLARLEEVKTQRITKSTSGREKRDIEAANLKKLAESAVREVRQFTGEDGAAKKSRSEDEIQPVHVVGIVVNRVATARMIFEQLRELEDPQEESRVLLLTGRVRPLERDELLYRNDVHGQPGGWIEWLKSTRDRIPEKPLYVVATQTIEVGADVSFDALVTEAASLDSLRQRFGRLDRLGYRGTSEAVILARKDLIAGNAEDDMVYGSALKNTWNQLTEWADTQKKTQVVNFGLNTMQAHLDDLEESALPNLLPPQSSVPKLRATDLDELCQTSPTPEPSPDISILLHGVDLSREGGQPSQADVQIVWRGDLRLNWDSISGLTSFQIKNEKELVQTVNLLPPSSPEILAVPAGQVKRWLRSLDDTGSAKTQVDYTLTDVEGTEGVEMERTENGKSRSARNVLRWHGPDDERTRLIPITEIRPGDTIIVPSDWGGCDVFGWNPESVERIRDLGELAQLQSRYRPVLRVHPDLPGSQFYDAEELKGDERLSFPRLEVVDKSNWCNRLVHKWDTDKRRSLQRYSSGQGRVFRSSKRWNRQDVEYVLSGPVDDPTEIGNANDNSSNIGREVPLEDHCRDVGKRAALLAELVGCADLCELMEIAGQLHDLGKADSRFQCWLRDGDWLQAALHRNELLAKSGCTGSGKSFEESREKAGWPKGNRHEAISVRLVESNPPKKFSSEQQELLRYLIGAHHGYGRPFFPPVHDPNPEMIDYSLHGENYTADSNHLLHRLDSGWADLFWTMNRTYGRWGLAWLESLLRLADQMISDEEQEQEQQKEMGAMT